MKNIKFKLLAFAAVVMLSTQSCLRDLDTEPKYDMTLEYILQQDPKAVEGMLSRLYASFALSSVKGPGDADISVAYP